MATKHIISDKFTRNHRIEQEQAFMAQASHDVKSLLTSVKAYVQLLERELVKTKDEKALVYANKIDSQVNKVTWLMSNVVDVYKIKAGELELYKEKIPLKDLLTEIVEETQSATITHTLSYDKNAEGIVFADKSRLKQAVGNILHNAIKFSPKKKEVILTTQKNSQTIDILIEDFGNGISPEKLPAIFDPFLRNPTESIGHGSGVFIAASIIKAHKGNLTIESKVGKGTKVQISLPVV